MKRRTTAVVATTAVAAGAACLPTALKRRPVNFGVLRRSARRWTRRLAGAVNVWRKRAGYRLAGGRPDPDVSDLVLTDRIRSMIGPLEKRLDIPHIHVMVNDHVALLHGDVADVADAETIEHAVRRVSGVHGVESFLHIGLLTSDTRPSEGRAGPQPPSDALAALLRVAARANGGRTPGALVRAVLSVFLDVVPDDERRHVLGHLPDDVRELADPRRRPGTRTEHIRTTSDLLDAIVSADLDLDLDVDDAERATVAVLAGLARLIPEEVSDLAATLPHELRELWRRARRAPDGTSATAHAQFHLLERT